MRIIIIKILLLFLPVFLIAQDRNDPCGCGKTTIINAGASDDWGSQSALTTQSVTGAGIAGDSIRLVNDLTTPPNNWTYATDVNGVRGYQRGGPVWWKLVIPGHTFNELDPLSYNGASWELASTLNASAIHEGIVGDVEADSVWLVIPGELIETDSPHGLSDWAWQFCQDTPGAYNTVPDPDIDDVALIATDHPNWVIAINNRAKEVVQFRGYVDTLFRVYDDQDTTKQFYFIADSISAGTDRYFSLPDFDGKIVVTDTADYTHLWGTFKNIALLSSGNGSVLENMNTTTTGTEGIFGGTVNPANTEFTFFSSSMLDGGAPKTKMQHFDVVNMLKEEVSVSPTGAEITAVDATNSQFNSLTLTDTSTIGSITWGSKSNNYTRNTSGTNQTFTDGTATATSTLDATQNKDTYTNGGTTTETILSNTQNYNRFADGVTTTDATLNNSLAKISFVDASAASISTLQATGITDVFNSGIYNAYSQATASGAGQRYTNSTGTSETVLDSITNKATYQSGNNFTDVTQNAAGVQARYFNSSSGNTTSITALDSSLILRHLQDTINAQISLDTSEVNFGIANGLYSVNLFMEADNDTPSGGRQGVWQSSPLDGVSDAFGFSFTSIGATATADHFRFSQSLQFDISGFFVDNNDTKAIHRKDFNTVSNFNTNGVFVNEDAALMQFEKPTGAPPGGSHNTSVRLDSNLTITTIHLIAPNIPVVDSLTHADILTFPAKSVFAVENGSAYPTLHFKNSLPLSALLFINLIFSLLLRARKKSILFLLILPAMTFAQAPNDKNLTGGGSSAGADEDFLQVGTGAIPGNGDEVYHQGRTLLGATTFLDNLQFEAQGGTLLYKLHSAGISSLIRQGDDNPVGITTFEGNKIATEDTNTNEDVFLFTSPSFGAVRAAGAYYVDNTNSIIGQLQARSDGNLMKYQQIGGAFSIIGNNLGAVELEYDLSSKGNSAFVLDDTQISGTYSNYITGNKALLNLSDVETRLYYQISGIDYGLVITDDVNITADDVFFTESIDEDASPTHVLSIDQATGQMTQTSIADLPAGTAPSFNISDGITSANITTGETITFNPGTGLSANVSATNIVTYNLDADLNDLNNVSASPVAGHILQYDGANWVNTPSTSGADNWGSGTFDITDGPNTVTVSQGDNIRYYAGNGMDIVVGPSQDVTYTLDAQLNHLTDVNVFPTSTGQVIKWNGASWIAGTDDTGGGGGADDWGSGTFNISDGVTTAIVNESETITFADGTGINLSVSPTNVVTPTLDAELNDLTNVNTTPSNGQVLKYNGSNWIAGMDDTGAAADNWGSGNFTIGDGVNSQTIDDGENINFSDAGGIDFTIGPVNTVSASLSALLSDLGDVENGTPLTGETLEYNGVNWGFVDNTYLNLNDTGDNTFTGKSRHVPLVSDTETRLNLVPLKSTDLENVAVHGSDLGIFVPIPNSLEDDDNDTKVLLDASFDNDEIQFYTAGTQRGAITQEGQINLTPTYAGTSFGETPAYINCSSNPAGGIGAHVITVSESSGNGSVMLLNINDNNIEGQNYITFRREDSNILGRIYADTDASVAYFTASDARLKENIKDTKFGLNDLLKIKVRDYNFLKDRNKRTGFIAQELNAIGATRQIVYKGGKNEKTDPWGVDYGKLTPLLVQSIQDLTKIVEQQGAEIKALKKALKNKN